MQAAASPRGQRHGGRRCLDAHPRSGTTECRAPPGARRRRVRRPRCGLDGSHRARRAAPGSRVGESALLPQQLSRAAPPLRRLSACGPRADCRPPRGMRPDRGARSTGLHVSRRGRRSARTGGRRARTAHRRSFGRRARTGGTLHRHRPEARHPRFARGEGSRAAGTRRPRTRTFRAARPPDRPLPAPADRSAQAPGKHRRRGSTEQPRSDAPLPSDARARLLLYVCERRTRSRPPGGRRYRPRPIRPQGDRAAGRRIGHVFHPGTMECRGARAACRLRDRQQPRLSRAR